MKQPRRIVINTASRYTYFSTLISLIPPSYRALLLRPSNHPLSGITHSPNYWVLHRNNPEPTHNTSEPKSNPTDSLCLRPLTCPLILNCCEPTGNNNEPNNNTFHPTDNNSYLKKPQNKPCENADNTRWSQPLLHF